MVDYADKTTLSTAETDNRSLSQTLPQEHYGSGHNYLKVA